LKLQYDETLSNSVFNASLRRYMTAHAADRDAEDAVAHQQLAARYDVLFGGGRTRQISPATSSTRSLSLVV
jgi:hypothetical protein